MKKLTILLALIIPVSIFSQNISVKSFREVPNDMTARVTAPVTDQNGDKCALIKIRTTQKGFVFEGDMLGITKTIQKVAEIWMYVPAKAKRLTIKHQELGVLDNYLYTEAIKEATVYIMELTTAKVVTTIVEQEIKTAYLIIKTKPEGADVYIDDTYLGITPFSKKMTTGTYSYRVEMEMYNTSAGKLEITGDNPRKEIDLILVPAFGFAKIISFPENGATVSIDGENTEQKTPMTTKKLKSGTHRVSLKLPMYQPVSKEFTITQGQTTELQIELKPSFATVTINTSPVADIYIDAEKIGRQTYSGRIMQGVHSFEAKKEKYHDAEEQIELIQGENKIINLNLVPKTGTLDIITNPMDATIKLNGQDKGKTPNILKRLLIGDYNLSLEKKNFNPINKTITINENQTTRLNETFIKTGKTKQTAKVTAKSNKPAFDLSNQLTDNRDGKVYKIVKIGNQVWMAENLAYYTSNGCWAYKNKQRNVNKYGYLYNCETAKNVCPDGWHLPSKSDFEILLDNYGGSNNSKANYTALIPSGYSGFFALFAGWRYDNGSFDAIGDYGGFWSATAYSTERNWGLYIYSRFRKSSVLYSDKSVGLSVRCLKN